MARERHPIDGRTVLITGAARGIGAESARQLAARGARLALVDLAAEPLEALAGELGSERAAAFQTDVTDMAAVERTVAEVVERFGGIDVVVANAGVAAVGTVETLPVAEFERVIEVNLLGVWRTVRAALPHVIARRGYVLCTASLAAAVHAPLMAPYAASKAGVEAFANALRGEVADRGVAVGVAYFGFIDTDMVRNAYEHPAAAQQRARGPSWASRPLPVSAAGRAIADGIERRARRVMAPRGILPALLAPGLVQPLFERAAARRGGVAEAVRIADATARGERRD